MARSTFPSEKAKHTSRLDHFWKFRLYRKSARCCGAKHISKSKCTKHTMYGPLLEVEMSKKCTPLWLEAHFEVKHVKNTRGSDHFWKLRCRTSARRCGGNTFRSSNVKNTRVSDHFWTFRCRFARQAQGIVHLVKSEQSVRVLCRFNYNHHYTTLHDNYNYTFTTLHYATLHSNTLHDNYTTFHYATLHYTTQHSTTQHYITLHYTTLH